MHPSKVMFCLFRYTIYSPKDGQPCMDHDRQSGEVHYTPLCHKMFRDIYCLYVLTQVITHTLTLECSLISLYIPLLHRICRPCIFHIYLFYFIGCWTTRIYSYKNENCSPIPRKTKVQYTLYILSL